MQLFGLEQIMLHYVQLYNLQPALLQSGQYVNSKHRSHAGRTLRYRCVSVDETWYSSLAPGNPKYWLCGIHFFIRFLSLTTVWHWKAYLIQVSFIRKRAAVCKSTYPTDCKFVMWAHKTGNIGVLAITNVTEGIIPTRGAKSLSYSVFNTAKATVFYYW